MAADVATACDLSVLQEGKSSELSRNILNLHTSQDPSKAQDYPTFSNVEIPQNVCQSQEFPGGQYSIDKQNGNPEGDKPKNRNPQCPQVRIFNLKSMKEFSRFREFQGKLSILEVVKISAKPNVSQYVFRTRDSPKSFQSGTFQDVCKFLSQTCQWSFHARR